MKKLLLSMMLLSCLGGGNVHAQCATIDSLYRVLRVAKEDRDKINTLNALAEQLSQIGKEGQAAFYIKQSLDMAQKIDYDKGIADALTHIAIMDAKDLNQYQGSIHDFEQALKVYRDLDNKAKILQTLEIIGTYYFKFPDQENREKAQPYFEEALKVSQQLENKQKTVQMYETLGELYGLLEQDDRALQAYEQAEALRLSLKMRSPLNARILAKYKRIRRVEERLQNTQAFQLTLIFGTVIAILLVITFVMVRQRNLAKQHLKTVLDRVSSS